MNNKLAINSTLVFEETYQIKGKRLPRLRKNEVEITLNIPTFDKNELPVAFIVKGLGINRPKTNFYLYNDKLYTLVLYKDRVCNTEGKYPVSKFIEEIKREANDDGWCISPYYDTLPVKDESVIRTKEKREKYIRERFETDYIIIDNGLYKVTGEPTYHISTFGMGGNHGGTGMFVDCEYNSNRPKRLYFNALQRKECLAAAKKIAKGRKDTDSVKGMGKYCNIQVLIPEAVKL